MSFSLSHHYCCSHLYRLLLLLLPLLSYCSLSLTQVLSTKYKEEADTAFSLLDKERRQRKEFMDKLNIENKSNIKKRQLQHSKELLKKATKVKELQSLVNEMVTLRNEMSAKDKSNNKSVRIASRSKKAAQHLATIRHGRMIQLKSHCDELQEELVDKQHTTFDLEQKITDLEEVIHNVASTDDTFKPFIFKKQYTKFPNSNRGNMQWKPQVDKLCIEMLANRTPPRCIQANIVAMAHIICPNMKIVEELPSLKHIRHLGTVLSQLTRTLAAKRLGDAKEWKQVHFDETGRRQINITDVVVGILNKVS